MQSTAGLIDIGSCPIHLIHNSFKNGIESVDWPTEEFLHNLVFWFSRSPSRRADYLEVAKTLSSRAGKFIRRFILTRWLDVGPIVERVIDQWSNLKEYFCQFIPVNNKLLANNPRYTQITTSLQATSTLIRLNFLLFLYRNIYERILLWFQQTQPLIHLLHDECEQLVRRLLSCFVNDDLVKEKSLDELLKISFQDRANQKHDSAIDIGEVARHCVRDLPEDACKEFFVDVRNIYCLLVKELLRTLPLNNDLLRHLQCLHPTMRHAETSHTSIMNIARSFPSIILSNDIDRINAEWYIYQNENVPHDWFETPDGYRSIDDYWRNIFSLKTNSGAEKFVGLAKLVKCVLALSHGNADVERGFSENGLLLSDDRTLLSDASINGLRATRDGVRFFGNGKPHEVPITKGLLDSVRDAHSRYCADLEKQQQLPTTKTRAAEQVKRASHSETENDLQNEQKFLYKDLANIQKLIDEGTERLGKAVSSQDFQEIGTAQLLIQGGNEKLAVTNTQMLANNNRLNQLNQLRKKQKKSTLF